MQFSANVNGETFVLCQGQTVAIVSPLMRVVVTDCAGTELHVGALTPFSSPGNRFDALLLPLYFVPETFIIIGGSE